jgi:6-phosphogluconolactonase/glucosamine-6-phosphate isomerase/deaminase
LKGAKRIILPIFGEKKQALFDKVAQQGSSREYPVRHVLCHDDPRCEVFLAP